jgi:hypothetical protein
MQRRQQRATVVIKTPPHAGHMTADCTASQRVAAARNGYCGGPAARRRLLVACWPAGLIQVTEIVVPGRSRVGMLAR